MLALLRSTIGRKLIALFITPILTGILVAVNAVLPEGSRFTPEQMKEIVTYMIGLIAGFIAMQGTVDTVNAVKMPKPVVPIAPTNVIASPIPDDMK